jgi:hypothetical protein
MLLETLAAIGAERDIPLDGKNEGSKSSAQQEGQQQMLRIAENRFFVQAANGNHGCAPAKTSRPFSNPYVSNASFRFLLS